MKSTAEQLPVIQYEGNHLVVKAYAGCGKTSTLVAYAEQHPHLRILYLAYNRAIRDEGAAKFPRNVARRIFVGTNGKQIYRWRGAESQGGWRIRSTMKSAKARVLLGRPSDEGITT